MMVQKTLFDQMCIFERLMKQMWIYEWFGWSNVGLWKIDYKVCICEILIKEMCIAERLIHQMCICDRLIGKMCIVEKFY